MSRSRTASHLVLAIALVALVGGALPRAATAAVNPQVPLAGSAIPQFVDPLPLLAVQGGPIQVLNTTSGEIPYTIRMCEFRASVLPSTVALPGGAYAGTWVWGYLPDPTGTSTCAQLIDRYDDPANPGVLGSYLGPVVLAQRGVPTELKFVNDLGSAATTNVLAYKYSTDQTLHWADPANGEANMWNHMAMPPAPGSEGASNYAGSIPAVVHLHGGEVPPQLDGGPDSWFTSDGSTVGHAFYSKDGTSPKNYAIYRYPNTQEGAPIWFHDHTLGATRLNVYAGLAGAYLIADPANDPTNLPEGPVPLVIQDRMFDANGQLYYPADSSGGLLSSPNPEHPYWVPEFVGDTIVVNGKAWPYHQVAPKRYTFLFLNGSNARTYEMFLNDPVSGNPGPPLWVIGTDGGYLDKPVKVGAAGNNKLVMMSGERYQVIIDFAGYQAGVKGPNGKPYSGNWVLRNTAKTPFPNGAAALGGTTGKIMQFRVVGVPGGDTSFNPAAVGATLRGGTNQGPAIKRLANPATGTIAAGVTVTKTRQLTLNEVMGMPQTAVDPVTGALTAYPGGPLEILVNNTKWTGERINGVDNSDPNMPMYTFESRSDFTLDGTGRNWISETPDEGTTEVWEIVNLTADAHPIHLHLVQFQLLNRQSFDTAKYNAAYAKAFPGGGYDAMTGQPYPAGVYIPGFGPPSNYNTGNARALGGNPDIAKKDAKGKYLYLKGTASGPLPQEAGWKDTVIMYPGQVTRIAVRWAPTDLPASTTVANAFFPFDPNGGHGYVWHCHIVDHEDNEMMRPDEVVPNAGATRTYVQGTDY
jgi:spore coat protein A